jgi:hypothetical protein
MSMCWWRVPHRRPNGHYKTTLADRDELKRPKKLPLKGFHELGLAARSSTKSLIGALPRMPGTYAR